VGAAVSAWIIGALFPAAASAQPGFGDTSTNFSIGWSEIRTENGDSLLDGTDGWFIDTDFAWRINPDSPLWLSFGVAGSYYNESEDVSSGVGFNETDIEFDLAMFALEPRLRFVIQPGGEGPGIYIAPRIGAGLLIADIDAASITEFPGGGFSVSGDSETEFWFEVRPAIELGFSGGAWAVGAEASYMWAWADEDAIGDTLEELRLGIFFRFAN
jgi:hypothetical protein